MVFVDVVSASGWFVKGGKEESGQAFFCVDGV
jgi:hypothetical protein